MGYRIREIPIAEEKNFILQLYAAVLSKLANQILLIIGKQKSTVLCVSKTISHYLEQKRSSAVRHLGRSLP